MTVIEIMAKKLMRKTPAPSKDEWLDFGVLLEEVGYKLPEIEKSNVPDRDKKLINQIKLLARQISTGIFARNKSTKL